jgi:cobalt-zinc-cadmium efflux system membrane fusion protein
VKKGDVLAVIRVPELGKIRAAYAASMEKAKAARSNAERTKALVDQRLGAQQTLLDAQASADALDMEARSLGEQLAAMGVRESAGPAFELALRAPLSGVVIARDAVVGQPVTADQVLGSIADLSEVWFLGRVFEKDLGRLLRGADAEVELNAYSDQRFAGSVEYIGRQVDPGARTVTARIRLQNREELLRIGLFGTAHVSTEEKEAHVPLIVIPRSALTEIGGKSAVFVLQSDGSFEMHEVAVGDAALGKVEVISGLREGEQVVVEGVFTLKSVVLKSAIADDE